jgi:hypothetical protein
VLHVRSIVRNAVFFKGLPTEVTIIMGIIDSCTALNRMRSIAHGEMDRNEEAANGH